MNIISKVTLRGLKKNKVRTIVTIIGIILSAAMFTAVTTLISSMQNYMVRQTIAQEGSWHSAVHNIGYDDYEKLKDMDVVEDTAIIKAVGYSILEGNINEYKPYLYLVELDDKAYSMLPIHLTRGRLPQNKDEILISEHIKTDGGVDFEIGTALRMELGDRISDGYPLGQKVPYIKQDDSEEGVSESLDIKGTRTFTIVGEMRRLSYGLEGYSAPGYTVVTLKDFNNLSLDDKQDSSSLSVYFTTKNVRNIYETADKMAKELGISLEYFDFNDELLRFMGISEIYGFRVVLYSLGAILIGLIIVGSVSLIYNSFSISVSERTKQFGLLSSVGATSIQLRRSVFFEAFVLALIGIPLGVLAGILGIHVTLFFISNLLAYTIRSVVYVPLKLYVSPLSVVAAVVIAFITILISAYIPSKRSGSLSAVEAIRQTADIKLKGKQVKTSRFTRKLFGLEGDLALKNLKRNRRRYRSTVISLFISVVLFISASAFSMYLMDSVSNVYEDDDYDLSYYTGEEQLIESRLEVYDDILALESVNQGSSIITIHGYEIQLSEDEINKAFYEEMMAWGYNKGEQHVQVSVNCVDHATFLDYIKGLGLDESQFSDSDMVTGVVIDNQHYFDYEAKKYKNSYIFKDRKTDSLTFEFNVYGEETVTTADLKDVKVAAIADTAPFGLRDYIEVPNSIMFIIDERSMGDLLPSVENRIVDHAMYFKVSDPFEAEADIKEVLNGAGLPTRNLINKAQILQANRNLITIISIFSYGFIILISLITIANVFNTISTNVNLRRREFAMLKSVGMTDRSFNKMLNFECIFYGLKALLYGLPVSVFITYLIYKSIGQGVEMAFYLPVKGIMISVFSVFLVVFISMMYSMSKIRKENILDALKNENL